METPLTKNLQPGGIPLPLKDYEAAGGYQAVRKALGSMKPEDVTETVKQSNLQGRGGAGFPTGLKWSFVPIGDRAPHPKYLVCNADEMEPGTFKDRVLLEGDPHSIIEGMIVSAYAIQADVGYVFLRWEYRLADERLRRAIAETHPARYPRQNTLGSGGAFLPFF